MATEVTRYVKEPVQRMLWGMAAGRCEFADCNTRLWKSPTTQEQVNIAEKAHIYSVSEHGPRGNEGIPEELLNDLQNLMLVCNPCHESMDQDKAGVRYTPKLLQRMKRQHEQRINIVADIKPSQSSKVVLYGANIGNHSSPLQFDRAAHALFPERFPDDTNGIALGMVNSAFSDRDQDFWDVEASNLMRQFRSKIQEDLVHGRIRHLSVFGLAPQPLLTLLGSLLTDIPQAEVYQLHREPQTWRWLPDGQESWTLDVTEPSSGTTATPALVVEISATVSDDRIHSVIGREAAIWRVSPRDPHNDILRTAGQLREFRQTLRPVLDRIKAQHGQTTQLQVFPVMPVSAAIELGRIRMPKADCPWRIYDQINDRGGFVPAIELPIGEAE